MDADYSHPGGLARSLLSAIPELSGRQLGSRIGKQTSERRRNLEQTRVTIKWVFFDIGDVLFDEDAPHMLYFHSLHAAMRRNGVEVMWDEYHAAILACARVSAGTAIIDAARKFVSADDQWNKIYHE